MLGSVGGGRGQVLEALLRRVEFTPKAKKNNQRVLNKAQPFGGPLSACGVENGFTPGQHWKRCDHRSGVLSPQQPFSTPSFLRASASLLLSGPVSERGGWGSNPHTSREHLSNPAQSPSTQPTCWVTVIGSMTGPKTGTVRTLAQTPRKRAFVCRT